MDRRRQYVLWIVLLPLAAFVFCLSCTYMFHFEETVLRTPCSDICHYAGYNIFPSISNMIKSSYRRYVWSVAIGISCLARLYMPYIIRIYFAKFRTKMDHLGYRILINVTALLSYCELLAILGVSYVANRDSAFVHYLLFMVFYGTSVVHMILQLLLRRWCYNFKMPQEHSSHWNTQTALFATYFIVFKACGFFFQRHVTHCEPFMFSLFGLSEYSVCVLNCILNVYFFLDTLPFYGEMDQNSNSVVNGVKTRGSKRRLVRSGCGHHQ